MRDRVFFSCHALPPLISRWRMFCMAARLPDGRVVCVGKNATVEEGITAEIKLEEMPSEQGPPTGEAARRWRELPGMSVAREGCCGCVLSDGRFAVFGGETTTRFGSTGTMACEVLSLDGGVERRKPLPPMHDARTGMACSGIGGCVIVAGMLL